MENTLVKVLLNWPEEFRKHGEHKAIFATTQPKATTLDSFLRSKKNMAAIVGHYRLPLNPYRSTVK